ncbi:hypothetical protein DXG01_011323 [Tephrocybe rancida]|nr:hypothetical protein DXG01_011323 [Tephrocybe rancida]
MAPNRNKKPKKPTVAELRKLLPKLVPTDKVPIPKLKSFTDDLVRGSRKRSTGSFQAETVRRARQKAINFLKYADVIEVPISIDDLSPRVKMESVQDAYEKLIDPQHPIQARSGKWVDKDGKILMYYLSSRPMSDGPPRTLDWSMQHEGRTIEDMESMKEDGVTMMRDGLTPEQCEKVFEVTQRYAASSQPAFPLQDSRHLLESANPRVMRYAVSGEGSAPGQEQQQKQERCGVYHLVHSWIQQNQVKGGLYASKGMTGSGISISATHRYLDETSTVVRCIAAMFEVLYPETYTQYKEAFDAGVWMKEDPGPWLGRAVVYKLQIHLHLDDDDQGPTVSFPVGSYRNGRMIVPQLGAKLAQNWHGLVLPKEQLRAVEGEGSWMGS